MTYSAHIPFRTTIAAIAASAVISVVVVACSTTTISSQSGTTPAAAAADIGKSCSGGCNQDLCIVTSTSDCSTGDCLVDSRGGLTSIDSYCTGDCTAAACPTGFACQAVPAALTGDPLKRCVKDGSAGDGGVDGASPDAAAGCGLAATGNASCDSCMTKSCCAEQQACNASSDCLAFLKCSGACNSPTCQSACQSQHSSGAALFGKVDACATAHCDQACAQAGGGGISACFSTSTYKTCNAYCASKNLTCATNCVGANGGFTSGQAGFGYASSQDCSLEVSSGSLVLGCQQAFISSSSPSARCCCQ